ncbi:MAG: hypothetical protein LBJ03_01645 [Holosporales bacterium]|nr:hypothetical protein [Holosporales bacterium]
MRLANGKVFVEHCSDLGVPLETEQPARWGYIAGGVKTEPNMLILASQTPKKYYGSEISPFAKWYYRGLLTPLVQNLAPDQDAFRILVEFHQMED